MADARTITISLSPELAKDIDRVAADEDRSRSELVREAMRQYIDRRKRWDRIFAIGKEIGQQSDIEEVDVMKIVKASRRASRRT